MTATTEMNESKLTSSQSAPELLYLFTKSQGTAKLQETVPQQTDPDKKPPNRGLTKSQTGPVDVDAGIGDAGHTRQSYVNALAAKADLAVNFSSKITEINKGTLTGHQHIRPLVAESTSPAIIL